MLVLGIVTQDLLQFPFHGLLGLAKYYIHSTILNFDQVLGVTPLPWFMMISANGNLHSLTRKCQKLYLRCRTYLDSKGILTFFPFSSIRLGSRLGLTNPWLICIVKEPLPFQRYGFSPYLVPTLTKIFNTVRSKRPCGRPSALSVHLSTANSFKSCLKYR